MNQLAFWLGAGVLLVSGTLFLAARLYRAQARLDNERRHAQRTAEVHLATIEALALAIDAKDQPTHNHIRRVQVYAAGIAHALGMSEGEVEAVKTAALLHDIGKLAVPEHILAKPGALTPEEFQKVRIHPQVGAEIIASVPFTYPVAPLILNHHERWDGRGYPAGLAGDAIPLSARIVSVADVYDALVTAHKYKGAWTSAEAIRHVLAGRGAQFEPRIVDALVAVVNARGTTAE